METALEQEKAAFLTNRDAERANAMQRAALQIVAGIDLDRLKGGPEEEKRLAGRRLVRLIERERLKGVRGHWSYDLNRHIALKQVLDALTGGKQAGPRNGQSVRHEKRRPERGEGLFVIRPLICPTA